MKKRTLYQMVIDQSGSMQGSEHQVIVGFNEHLQSMKSTQEKYPEQEIIMSLKFFNNEVGPNTVNFEPVSQCHELSRHHYHPTGSTALLDAIGKSIYDIKTKFGSEIHANGTTVVFIIITDGHENASRMYTFDDIQRMIGELEATENWNFTFMGADLDAINAASRYGIQANSTISFDKSDYARVSRDYLSRASEDYAQKKQQGEKPNGFFDIFDKKDLRKK
ncbi:MAG: hypothetical protein EBU82_09230 [Flavobacteriia bacterium]|nr:hypothetical protein [Flavobacteriia bacterium]